MNKPPSPAAWPTSKGHNFPHAGVACSLTSMQPIAETFCFEGTVSVWEHTAVPTEANELFHAVREQAMQNRQAPFVRNLHAKARHMPCFSHQSKMPEQVLIQPHRKEPHILLGFVIWDNSLVWARTHVRSVRLVLHQRSKLATTLLNVHGAGIEHTDATRSSRSNIRDTQAKFAATRRHPTATEVYSTHGPTVTDWRANARIYRPVREAARSRALWRNITGQYPKPAPLSRRRTPLHNG